MDKPLLSPLYSGCCLACRGPACSALHAGDSRLVQSQQRWLRDHSHSSKQKEAAGCSELLGQSAPSLRCSEPKAHRLQPCHRVCASCSARLAPSQNSPESQPANLGNLFSLPRAPKLSRMVPGSAGHHRGEGAVWPVLSSQAVPAELWLGQWAPRSHHALLGVTGRKVMLLMAGKAASVSPLALQVFNQNPSSTLSCLQCRGTVLPAAAEAGSVFSGRWTPARSATARTAPCPARDPAQVAPRPGGALGWRYQSVRGLGGGSPRISPRLFTANPAASSALPGATGSASARADRSPCPLRRGAGCGGAEGCGVPGCGGCGGARCRGRRSRCRQAAAGAGACGLRAQGGGGSGFARRRCGGEPQRGRLNAAPCHGGRCLAHPRPRLLWPGAHTPRHGRSAAQMPLLPPLPPPGTAGDNASCY